MPFKFLDENDASVSSPPIVPPNVTGSNAGAPKSTPESTKQSSFRFTDSPESGIRPSADDLQGLMAEGYKPGNEDLRTIYEQEQATPLLKRAWKGVKEGAAGVVEPFLKAPGEIAQDPSASRLLSSAGEGITGAAAGTVGMVFKPLSYLADKIVTGQITPNRTSEENFQRWKLNYLATHDVGAAPLPQSIMQSWSEFANNEPVPDAAMIKPYPNVSSAIGTVASLPMFEAGAGALGVNKLLTGIPKLNLTGKALGAAGKVLETTGKGFKWLGDAPAAAAEGVSKRVLGEELAETVGHTVKARELPVAGAAALLGEPTIAATLAGAKTLEKAAPVVTGAGQFASRIAKADPASPFGRLYSVAKDASAPQWMRALADSWVTKVPAAIAETAATGVKSAAVGGLFGAGLEALSGGNAEDIGRGIGSGAAFGVLTAGASAPALRKAKIMQRSMADIENFYSAHLSDGVAPESLRKVGNDAMTWGATMERIFGDGTKIRFAGEDAASPLPKDVYGQAGVWKPENKTLWVNVDAKRDPGATVLHEIMHPIFEGEVVNRPELKMQIDQALQASGRSLYQAKVRYSMSLLKAQLDGIKNPLQKQALIDQAIQARDAASQSTTGDPNAWAYSEILSEAGAQALFGQHPIFDVLEPGIVGPALESVKGFLQKLGVEFKEKPTAGKPATVLPGFENVIDSPALRKTVYALIKAQKEFLPGLTPSKSQGVKISKEMWGQHPGATLEVRPNGVKGNDFVIQKPDGTIIPRPAREVKKITKNRRKEVNELYPLGGTPLPSTDQTPGISVRTTPSGLVERSGTHLGPGFDNLTSFGPKTKTNAHDLEAAIANGESRAGWYQQIGEGPEWKASVKKDTGALEAQYKEFIPINFLVDKQGNLLVRNYSLTALDRKAAEWSARKGPISLELWGSDIGNFKQDVATYLKNHSSNLPGESNGIGVEKKNVINAFLVGGNRTFEAQNPMRNSLRGADRQGIVRSYRLDRLETLEPGESLLTKPQYHKQVMNLSPGMGSSKLKVGSELTAKGWITPDTKFVPLEGELHSGFLVKNAAELKKKHGVDFAKYPDTDADKGPRIPALNKGFARVNYERNSGTLTIEANIKHWNKKMKDSVFNIVADNVEKIDHIRISLLDDKANVKKHDSAQLFQFDDAQKLENIPFVSQESSGRRAYSPDVETTQGQVKHNEDVRKNATDYMTSTGRDYKPFEDYKPLDEAYSKAVADFYQEAKHSPSDPAVQAAYKAFGEETVAQWKFLTDKGVKMEPWTGEGQPYKSSADMTKDVRDNQHLYFFPTEKGFGTTEVADHPLLAPSGISVGETPLLINDVFRAVHDYFGHSKEGYEFGPRGEHNAYQAHSRMYSKEALPAMAAETQGQNSWVNFGPHLRNEKGAIPKKGEEGFKALTERPFAEQKAVLLPAHLRGPEPSSPVEISEMGAGDFFEYASAKQKAAMAPGSSNKLGLQRTAEAMAEKFPDKKLWESNYKAASDTARQIYAEVAAAPNTMLARQVEIQGAAQKAQFFSEGLKQLSKMSPDVASPESIASNLGARFDGELGGRWMFTAFDSKGKESTTFATKKGVSPEDVLKKYNETRDRFDGEPDQPRPAKDELHSEDLIQADGTYSPAIDPTKEHVKQAAIETPDGKVWLGGVHAFAAMQAEQAGYDLSKGVKDGFWTSNDRFVNREEAKQLAIAAGQLSKPKEEPSTPYEKEAREYAADPKAPLEAVTFATARSFSPDQPEMFSKSEVNPMGEKAENVKSEELLYPNRKLTPTELAASNLARKELRDRVQILPEMEDRVKLRRALNRGFAEVQEALSKQSKDVNFDSGADWYQKDLKSMEDTTRKIFPETKDETKMTIFKSILAGLSPSAKPTENYRSAAESFAQYLKTGKFPATTPFRVTETGKRKKLGVTAQAVSEKMNELLAKTGGEKELVSYLLSKHPETLYGNKDAYGALDLGPKVGRFFLNLTGHSDEVTVDLWATRTFNRWMGTPFRKQAGKAELPDIPTDAERNIMIEAFNQIGKQISGETGVELTAMDVQAVLWYMEKDLYASLSSSGRSSFADAAKTYEADPLHKGPRRVIPQLPAREKPDKAQEELRLTKSRK